MDFVVDGQTFSITADDVRARLHGRSPGPLRKYWVEVDGVEWPVKQAFRLVVGPDVYFQSMTARDKFRRLGFAIGGAAESRRTVTASSGSRSRRFDPLTLPVADALEVRVALTWRTAGAVTLDEGGFPFFPALPSLPGLYRFDFSPGADGRPTTYIGESKDLAKRAGQYRNSKVDRVRARTSRRLHKELVAHLSASGRVDFSICVEVSIDDGTASADLRRTSARRHAENAAVHAAQLAGEARVINVDFDPDRSA
jgi:hypothetical protein